MGRYHITIVRPPDYLHSDCFLELAETLVYALEGLGHAVTFQENRIEPGATTILFGAHLLTEEQADALPATVVVYNLEQLGASWTPRWYSQLAARVRIWDYTQLHVEQWRLVPCVRPPVLVEIGYMPQMTRIGAAATEDIDVLFYGSMTQRRLGVLDALAAAGLRVERCFGMYGAARDAMIARAKVVLNLHAAETRVFELVRVSYLLANRKAVVAEESIDFGSLVDAVAVCTLETAVAVCRRLVEDAAEREALAERGFRLFSRRDQRQILKDSPGALAQE